MKIFSTWQCFIWCFIQYNSKNHLLLLVCNNVLLHFLIQIRFVISLIILTILPYTLWKNKVNSLKSVEKYYLYGDSDDFQVIAKFYESRQSWLVINSPPNNLQTKIKYLKYVSHKLSRFYSIIKASNSNFTRKIKE